MSLFASDTPLDAYQEHGGKAHFCRGSENGVHVLFGNGWTVSIQWGPGTYSDNHDAWFLDFSMAAPGSTTAEVACWFDPPHGPAHSAMARFADGDTVQGWRSWEQVQALLAAAAADALSEPISLWTEGDE